MPYRFWGLLDSCLAAVEATNFAIRFNEQAKRFYQRKAAKGNRIVAIKAVAHKLARASFYVMRDLVPFDSAKLFVLREKFRFRG